MVELNPQLGKQLRVIATSDEIVPTIFAFRADYDSPFKSQLIAAVTDLRSSVAGQQVLTIFQSDGMSQYPVSHLQSALDLIAAHARLGGETNGTALASQTLPLKAQP